LNHNLPPPVAEIEAELDQNRAKNGGQILFTPSKSKPSKLVQ